jgi:hypothetical protein
MARSPLRDSLLGYSMDQDRLWLLHTRNGTYAITEYNHELTGFSPELQALDNVTFRYGGNAYYVLGPYAKRENWRVEEFEDRQ